VQKELSSVKPGYGGENEKSSPLVGESTSKRRKEEKERARTKELLASSLQKVWGELIAGDWGRGGGKFGRD